MRRTTVKKDQLSAECYLLSGLLPKGLGIGFLFLGVFVSMEEALERSCVVHHAGRDSPTQPAALLVCKWHRVLKTGG